MDPGDRRRAAFRAARVSLILAANLVLLGMLLRLLAGGGDATSAASAAVAAPAGEASTSSAGEGARDRVPPPSTREPAELAELCSRVESLVAEAVEEARARTKGRANAQNVAVAVHVADVASGQELVARSADAPLRPASSLKLVTAASALVLLGADWRFETLFERGADLAGGVLDGDLVARAAGDPLVPAGEDGGAEEWLDRLAGALARAGVARVNGALVLDEGLFPDPAPGPAWPSEDQHWTDYCALAGGFSVSGGCLTASVRPGAIGSDDNVSVEPRDHGLERATSVRTIARGRDLSIALEVRGGAVRVQGEIPADVPQWRGRFAHPDPVALFGEVVVRGLARRGVEIEQGYTRSRSVPGGPIVARLASPLAGTLVPILRHSDNAVADQVFFATAVAATGAGTREAGRTATAQALRSLGLSADGLVQVDGSGLSRDDRVSARQLTRLVAAVLARGGEGARLYREALPVAGESGSLDDRMRDSPARGKVRAKTGWIGGTSALAGLVEPANAPPLVFAILVSYPDLPGLNSACFKPMQDAICETLVAFGEESD